MINIQEALELLECEFGEGNVYIEFSNADFGLRTRLTVLVIDNIFKYEFILPIERYHSEIFDLELDKAVESIQGAIDNERLAYR